MAKSKTDRASEATPAKTPDREPGQGETKPKPRSAVETVEEIGGRGGLDPTRYGDYEKDGRCIDF